MVIYTTSWANTFSGFSKNVGLDLQAYSLIIKITSFLEVIVMNFPEDYIKEQLKDPEFKEVWKETEEPYQIVAQIIQLRKNLGLTQKAVDQAIGEMVDKEAIDRLSKGNKEKLQLTDVLNDEDIDFDALNDKVHASTTRYFSGE